MPVRASGKGHTPNSAWPCVPLGTRAAEMNKTRALPSCRGWRRLKYWCSSRWAEPPPQTSARTITIIIAIIYWAFIKCQIMFQELTVPYLV